MFDIAASPCNALLATLSAMGLSRISPYLGRVQLSRGQTLHDPGTPVHYVYFPIDCIVSLQTMLSNGASDEIAIIGNEGVVGVALIMSNDRPQTRAVVRQAGYAWRLRTEYMRREFQCTVAFQLVLLRYAQALMAQIAQTAVCNRHHTLDQQLCRWLLMTLDRLPSYELMATQEQIANMLGVRRVGVTEAAGRLQRAAMIQCRRGRIAILNRRGLEATTCECYQIVQREYSRLAVPLAASAVRWDAETRRQSRPQQARALVGARAEA